MKEHGTAAEWIECDNCRRWYVDDCAEGYRGEDAYFKCAVCLDTQEELEMMLVEWKASKNEREEMKKSLVTAGGTMIGQIWESLNACGRKEEENKTEEQSSQEERERRTEQEQGNKSTQGSSR